MTGRTITAAAAVLAVTAIVILFLGVCPVPSCAAGEEILPFEPDDTLEEIRYKIDHNGYSFTVSDNWVFSMEPEEKERFFSRRRPNFPRPAEEDPGIGPLAEHLGKRALPSSFDWRNYGGRAYIGPVRDQNPCGACYAFSAVAAAEGTYNFANGLYGSNRIEFSESYIAWCLGRYGPYGPDPDSGHFGGCDGADYDYYELQALTQEGIILRSQFPYQVTDPGSCAYWGLPTTKFASWHRVPCNDTDAIKTAIMTYGVVNAAIEVSSAFGAYSGGIYQDYNTTCYENPCYYTPTDHAIALVGWNDADGGYWILRNSWGSSWGEGGYMRIRYTSALVACEVAYLVYGSSPASSARAALQLYAADFNGNQYSDIAIFRPSTGLWSIRGVTRAYFGQSGDIPVPADFNGDGTSDIAVFRPSSGLWSIRGGARFYFGRSGDIPLPMNFRAGYTTAGIFRPSTGLWSFRGGNRFYHGRSGDIPVIGPWSTRSGKWGEPGIAIFRPSSGLWSVRGVTRFYFGRSGDTPVPGDYQNTYEVSTRPWRAAVFRPSSGLWSVRGLTRAYFGGSADTPVPADYAGGWGDEMAIFRPSSGLWSIRNGNRYYYGRTGDTPATR